MQKIPPPTKAELRRHAQMIRNIGMCVAEFLNPAACNGPLQSCHVRKGSVAGMGRKPPKREVPMCANHHRIQSDIGEPRFWGERMNDAITLACVLGTMTDDLEQAKEECRGFRGN